MFDLLEVFHQIEVLHLLEELDLLADLFMRCSKGWTSLGHE